MVNGKTTVAELNAKLAELRVENAALRKQAKLADSANQAKSDFLAMISHEIRTPMNGVIGLSELLLDTNLNDKQHHFAKLIHTSAQNLLTLINSLLDFSKIEADKMVIEKAGFDLQSLLQQLIELYQLAGARKGLDVTLSFDDALAGRFLGDEYRIRQVLVNLIGNAIKFTDVGGVNIVVAQGEGEQEQDIVRFSVTDTGIGIQPLQLAKLFIPFSQVDTSSTRRYGGTGLGLSICAKLVHLMGGEIGVQSVEQQGSTFWFTLPLARVETPAPPPTKQPKTARKAAEPAPASVEDVCRILVVDDEETNLLVMTESLAKGGLAPQTAPNGEDAVRQCASQPFEIVFMDCQMPVLDGFDATKMILAECSRTGRRPPVIIALTADATSKTRKRCKEVGMTDYLVKPIDFVQVQNVLRRWLSDFTGSILPEGRKADRSPAGSDGQLAAIINTAILAKLEENVGNVDKVIAVFIRALRVRCQELANFVKAGDSTGVGKTAHTLKGSSSQFGAQRLAALCAQAEQMGKDGDLDGIERLFGEIEDAIEQVAAFFAARLDK